MTYSIVEFFPDTKGRSCGYCKGKNGNFSHGMWAHSLKPQDYEDLINRGWRRSGKYCYKPTLKKACCPMYTIRCNAIEFKASKSHKKILKKFRNYLEKDSGGDKLVITPVPQSSVGSSSSPSNSDDEDSDDFDEPNEITGATEKKIKFSGESISKETASTSIEESLIPKEETVQNKVPRPGDGPDPNKPRARKAKEIRMERKKAKNQGESLSKIENQPEPDSVEDIFMSLFDPQSHYKHRFEIKLVRATDADPEFRRTFEQSYNLYKKYQVAIHKDKVSKVTQSQFRRFLCSSPLMENQIVGMRSLERFWKNYLPQGFGGYHQQYWIDGNLVSVGVLDILPSCVSSVYLYYDPDYYFLSLGTLSAVMEMMYVRLLHRHWLPEIIYYYMGYYIHSCPKMRYKGQYEPSWLLCPETYKWIDIKKCTPLLDKARYTRFNLESDEPDEESVDPIRSDVSTLGVLHDRTAKRYLDYDRGFIHRNYKTEKDTEIFTYFSLVGLTVARRMLLYQP